MVDERKRLLPPRLNDDEDDNSGSCCCPRINNKLFAKITILATVMFERIAFYSICGNLILFLNGTMYEWTSYNAMHASYFFLGVSCVFYFLGGVLADLKLGRFKTIIIALLIYLAGYAFLIVLANDNIYKHLIKNGRIDLDCKEKHQYCAVLVYLALAIVATGTGMARANLAPFGADQLKREDAKSNQEFFNWYYWCINLGTLIALGAVSYVQQSNKDSGFFYGYLAGGACLFMALLIFLIGKCSYVYRRPVGSIIVNICKIFREAWRIRKRKKQQFDHRLDLQRGQSLTEPPTPTNFLDHAKFRFGGSYHDHSVDDIKKLGKILCVFLALVPYWMVYFQIETTFLVQGLHMKLSFSNDNITSRGCNPPMSHNVTTEPAFSTSSVNPYTKPIQEKPEPFKIAVAWLTLFDVIFLIISIPILDRIVYPWMRAKGWNFTMVKRIIVGLLFATLSICTAGVVETFRLNAYWYKGSEGSDACCYKDIGQKIQNTTYYAADLSILWQIPQYCLIGVSEVFTSVAGLEFASVVAPKSMKSSVMGLFYFFSGLGSFVGSGIMMSFQGVWFFPSQDHGNINCRDGCVGPETVAGSTTASPKASSGTCHLNYYFCLLGGIQFIAAIIFVILVKKLGLDTQLNIESANSGHVQNRTAVRNRSVPNGNVSTSDGPTMPRVVTAEIESEATISNEAQIPTQNDLSNFPSTQTVHRTVSKDRSMRIGVDTGNMRRETSEDGQT